MSIREAVKEKLGDFAKEALPKQHEYNYEFLIVETDGNLWWSENVNDFNGSGSPSLIRVGTGSVPCNCDWCSGPDAVDDANDIDFSCEEWRYLFDEMENQLDEIDIGFFDDETE